MTTDTTGNAQENNSALDTHAAHVLGALATRLNEALGQARQALAPHAQLLDDGTLAGLDILLAEFARRRVRIAMYGEVKAGKSTLINAIGGAALSPVAFEPLTSIPTRITYGSNTAWHVQGRRLSSVADLENLMRDGTAAIPEVVVETPLDLLQLGGQVDLLDTPGIGSADDFDAVSAAALRSLDAVVLVVRYPALFTQFTRRLMDGLQNDIGKLFVVWNLDADCAELTPQERERHAATLRANVAGAHELCLVDARAGFRAAQSGNTAALATSGLPTFAAALTRFAASNQRELAAVREAAKRAHHWLGRAQHAVTERHATLDLALSDARGRLDRVRAASGTEANAARALLTSFEARLAAIASEATAKVSQLAAKLRSDLQIARRQWIRKGEIHPLTASVNEAAACYADAVAAAASETIRAQEAAAADFGTTVSSDPRPRTQPTVEALSPEARSQRAAMGNYQVLRRAVWQRWYLPGLKTLERDRIDADVASYAAWLQSASQAAQQAAAATLNERLAEIAARAESAMQQIKTATHFTANETEFQQLVQHVPIVTSTRTEVAHINAEARALFGD